MSDTDMSSKIPTKQITNGKDIIREALRLKDIQIRLAEESKTRELTRLDKIHWPMTLDTLNSQLLLLANKISKGDDCTMFEIFSDKNRYINSLFSRDKVITGYRPIIVANILDILPDRLDNWASENGFKISHGRYDSGDNTYTDRSVRFTIL